MEPFTITRVRSQGVYDFNCHNGKVISATGNHLKVYRQQETSDVDDGSNSSASRDVTPACTYPDNRNPLSPPLRQSMMAVVQQILLQMVIFP